MSDPLVEAPMNVMLGIRPGMRLSVLHPPEGFMQMLEPLPAGVSLIDDARTGLDVTIFFTAKKTDLIEKLPGLARGMAVTGRIWVCFPHGSDDVLAPTEDFVRLAALEMGLNDDKKLVVDPAWNGLRLAWKPRAPRPEKPRAEA